MGLFDVASPALTSIDSVLGTLPSVLRLWLWGAIGGALSMGLYAWVSPQRRLRVLARLTARSQQRLNAFEGELASAWPLLGRHLQLAVARLGWVFGPTLLAALPVLFLYTWMGNTFAYSWPAAGDAVAVQPQPAEYGAAWVSAGQDGESLATIRISDPSGKALGAVALAAPVPQLHKRKWWNVLFGNPAGYLEAASPVEHVALALPAQEHVGRGPSWMRGWEFSFLLSLMVSALGLRTTLRIQ